MILVVAPTFAEANDWAIEHAEEHHLTRHTGWRYVNTIQGIQGRLGSKLVVLRSYALSPDQLAVAVQARKYLGDGCAL